MKHLKKIGQNGKRINLQCKLDTGENWLGYIYSNTFDKIISENGKHVAILYNNKVYDNLYPKGIDYSDWIKDFDFGYPNIYADFTKNIDF